MPTIRCQQYLFQISDPFEAGHRLSEAEASALNALRAENIRNSIAQQVRKRVEALDDDSALLSEAALAELRQLAARYDAEYAFGVRRAYSKTGPIEAEALLIAKGQVLAKARTQGWNLSEQELESLVEEEAGKAPVLEEARRRVGEHQRVAVGALESLL